MGNSLVLKAYFNVFFGVCFVRVHTSPPSCRINRLVPTGIMCEERVGSASIWDLVFPSVLFFIWRISRRVVHRCGARWRAGGARALACRSPLVPLPTAPKTQTKQMNEHVRIRSLRKQPTHRKTYDNMLHTQKPCQLTDSRILPLDAAHIVSHSPGSLRSSG